MRKERKKKSEASFGHILPAETEPIPAEEINADRLGKEREKCFSVCIREGYGGKKRSKTFSVGAGSRELEEMYSAVRQAIESAGIGARTRSRKLK